MPMHTQAGVAPPPTPLPSKTTVMGVQAPARPAYPGASDSWDVAPSDEEQTAVGERPTRERPSDEEKTAVNLDPSSATMPTAPAARPAPPPPPPAPVMTPLMPTVTPVVTPVAAPPPAVQVQPVQLVSAPSVGVTATDVRLIVRAIVDESLAPLVARLTALEKLAAAAAASRAAAPPAPPPTAPVAQPPPSVAHGPEFSAAMAPTPQPARAVVAAAPPRAPVLDVAAIERDVPLDYDMKGFDGGKRKRRMLILFVLALLVVFGGLFAMLANSYSPHN